MNALSRLKWSSIFVKIAILNGLFVFLFLGSKFAQIFFSWLNSLLAWVDYGIVFILVFLIGVAMFLLPPVPGSAVHIFAGIVLGSKSQEKSEEGFWLGVGGATIVGLVAKLLACVGQYGIGYFMGQAVSVQKFVGVDSVPIRAIESVLRRPGMDIGKVALFVAGSDWPISVVCGILRVNIPRMLLCTLPVYIASIVPQTIAGALLTRSGSKWDNARAVTTSFAAFLQAGAALMFMLVILRVITRDLEELTKPRAEHAAIKELTRKKQAYNDAYDAASSWSELSTLQRLVITLAAALHLISTCIFLADSVIGDICFRSFAISNKISNPYDESGLNNNVANVFILPGASIAVGIFVCAVALHVLHSAKLAWLARGSLTHRLV